jgi:hypothetical protein
MADTRTRRNLKTIGGVLSELGYVYRAYVKREITAGEATTRRALLAEIRETIEGHDVAQRLDQIEKLVEAYQMAIAAAPSQPRLLASRELS